MTAHENMQRCIDADEGKVDAPVKLAACSDDPTTPHPTQVWEFIKQTGQLRSKAYTTMCLDVKTTPPHDKRPTVLAKCVDGSELQQFTITPLSMLKCTQKWCKK